MKGLYLCARKHRLPGYPILYNDIDKRFKPDLLCDMRDLLPTVYDFEFVIATPPCNYYSKANYRRETSKVALETKDLLPLCLEYLVGSDIPFIIENVNNKELLPSDYDFKCFRFSFGGHTFWTNVLFDTRDLIPIKQNKQNVCRNKRDNNFNVHVIIERFLETIFSEKYLFISSKYNLSRL